MTSPAAQKLTLRLSPPLYAEVAVRADLRGMSMNDWINHAIRYGLSGKHGVEVVETIVSKKIEL
jgi:predicted HicB family RNase H-like nuclease